MENIYVFGHRAPDTDSVCSAIALAHLKNSIGQKCIPAVLSNINEETKYVLNYFKVKEPRYLNDVRAQIKDVNYNKNFYLDYHASIYDAYRKMVDNGVSAIPVVKSKKLIGIVSLKDLAKDLIRHKIEKIDTSYHNIMSSIEGTSLLKFDDEIKGHITAATYRSTTFIGNVPLTSNDILIVGDRHSVIEYAVNSKVKLIILTDSSVIKDEHLEIAKKNKVNIMKTDLTTLATIKRINLCNYIITLMTSNDSVTIEENLYVSDFLNIANKFKHSHYPIINKENDCLGMLKISDINDVNKKKVILVDHNEASQSVEGIEEANIIEIIDHHKIGNVSTKTPINFRNLAVGSTCTIIYILYVEYGIKIPNRIKGLLLSGILSDTLLFKSPTSTDLDIYTAKTLAEELELDYTELAMGMFKASSNYKNVENKKSVLYEDFKTFNICDEKVGVGQISTLNINDIKDDSDEYIDLLNKEAKINEYKVLILLVTDIINEGSYIFFNELAKDIIEDSFAVKDIKQGHFLRGYLSRKKQFIPSIIDAMEKN